MTIRDFKYISSLVAIMLLALSWSSCTDDFGDFPDYSRSGEKVTLRVKVDKPEMSQSTRADLDDYSLNLIESLWIRTYSSVSGEATSSWIKVDCSKLSPVTQQTQEVAIETLSGYSFIVAVANVDNMGVTQDDISTPKPLSELLTAANTWSDFLKIAVVSPSSQESVRAPIAPLPMAGSYSDIIVGGSHPEPSRIDEWQNKNFQPYFIPAQDAPIKFDGAIHLRRLVSHINFNIIPGNENIEISVNSFQLMNAPKFSWLYERPGENLMITNFGELASSQELAGNYYADVPSFGIQNITANSDGSSSFDFWQAENKYTGTCDTYFERDKLNGTLFTSLTGDTWSPANDASYVLISCAVNFKNVFEVDEYGKETEDGSQVYRSGDATYLIHLGNIIGTDEAEKAKDFNCFRNVNYTYNVKINGLTDIVVDAYAEDETYHGEEGVVVDLNYSTIDLDAHYGVFNVELTEEELKNEKFGFIITTYDTGRQITITDQNRRSGNDILDDKGNVIDPKYYNWIELRPTTSEYELATYKPRFGTNVDGKTFLLSDLRSQQKENGGVLTAWEGMTEANKSSSGWYTVFVNEYSYESIYTGKDGYADESGNDAGKPKWMSYVNANPRRFFIRVIKSSSPDGKSTYARSKYGISQQSMMSFYSNQTPTTNPKGTGNALERQNENEGMNMRYNFKGGPKTSNGRWNTALYLNNPSATTAPGSPTISDPTISNRPQWSTFITANKFMEVGGVVGDRAQGGPELPERTVANGNPVRLPKPVLLNSPGYSFNDPQGNDLYTIEGISACINRNRDNNGNGRIDPEEFRWYVPGIDDYLQQVLGKRSLPSPLMNYSAVRLPLVNKLNKFWTSDGTIENACYSRYMYAASNNGKNVMWLMEGTSISSIDNAYGWSKDTSRPWQIRCMRNLGTNMNTVNGETKVAIPYVHDEGAHTFSMSFYDLASIRSNKCLGNGNNTGQMPVHTLTQGYNNVYYAFEYATIDIEVPSASRPETSSLANFNNTYGRLKEYIESNPCASEEALSGTGWRVPNQVELTIMRNAGLFSNYATPYYAWLCCTVNYFNYEDGLGSNSLDKKLYLMVFRDSGSQLTLNNMGDINNNKFYIRCVRDKN